MSFGLMTAVNVDDIPKILRRVAENYRGTVTSEHLQIWYRVADEFDNFAVQLESIIEKAKKERVRL